MIYFSDSSLEKEVIYEVREAQSGKGLVLSGLTCSHFIWSNSKIAQDLEAALASWVSSGSGYEIVMIKGEGKSKEVVVQLHMVEAKKVKAKWIETESGFKVEGKTLDNPFL